MTREEAEKYAENMTYREAIYNLKQAKSVPYRKATFIKINELLNDLEQEPNTWSLDDAREDFMHDVYNTLDFLPTNEEANHIIDSFDRVTSSIEQEPILEKDGTLIVTTEHCEKVGRVLVQYGTNGTLFYQDQEPRIGHWVTKPHVFGVAYCSECDFELKINNTNFCPNCGADMREVEE